MRLRRAAPTLAIALATTALCALAAPPTARGESLADALAGAYRDNPTLKAARAQLRATNERVPQALSNWRPQVSVNTSVGRQKVKDESQFNTQEVTSTPRSATLQVRQPVYRGGQTIAGTNRAEFEVKSERKRVLNTQQDVLQRAVEAYMNVWRDREVLRLNNENVRSLKDQLKAAQARFERGVATRTDVAQARTRLARAKARREQTQGQLTGSRATYEEVIGHPPPEDLRYPDEMIDLPGSVEAAVSRAAANNPQVVAAKFASKAADREVRQRTGQLLPTVTLTGEVSRREQSPFPQDETQRAEVRLDLQIPLYQSGEVTSRIRQAKQTASQRRLQVAEAERRARQQARSAWGRLESARNQLNQRKTQVEAAKIAVRGAEEELQVGSRTVLDVLDAEQDLFNAQIGLIRARRDIAVARFGVVVAVGGLTARDLGLDVPLYDPKEAYEDVRGSWWSLSAPGADAGQGAVDVPSGGRETGPADRQDGSSDNGGSTESAPGAGPTKARAAEGDGAEGTAPAAENTGEDAGGPAAGTTEDDAGDGGPGERAPAGAASGDTDSGEGPATPSADGDGDADAEGETAAETQSARTPESDDTFGRADLLEVERLLRQLDFTTGKVDGRMDPETRAAIGRFQSAAGLAITYEADAKLLRELRAVASNME